MVGTRSPIFRFVLVALIVAIPATVFAAEPGARAVGGRVDFQVAAAGYERATLSISTPSGEVFSRQILAGEPISLSLKDLPSLEDGSYTYQISFAPRMSASLKQQLAAARAAGDEAGARAILKGAGIKEPAMESGAFMVVNGSVVAGGATENETRPIGGPEANGARVGAPVTNDQVIPDDLIVQQSLCVGFDCVNNESFGFDTIRLKENNTRIKFEDTSVGSFPTNDWQLTANDSASGGSSKFSIEDITGNKVPFTVTAGASTNSIFVDSTGRVGLRTSTPVLDLHINTSNTPAIRLEQNNSGGFTAQTWDIGANEANFFVRDVTSGSRLSFRIRPGAPTSSLDINADGNVGIGTASADEELTVKSDTGNENVVIVQNSSAGSSTIFRIFETTAGDGLFSVFDAAGNETARLTSVNSGRFSIGCNAPEHDLDLGATAGTSCASQGTRSFIDAGSTAFTNVSSRSAKENLQPMKVESILDKISHVGVYTYDYKGKDGPKDKLGLMAEDFHTVFQRGDDKTINGQDVDMALWLAVQELTARNKDLTTQNETLTKRLEKIESQISNQ